MTSERIVARKWFLHHFKAQRIIFLMTLIGKAKISVLHSSSEHRRQIVAFLTIFFCQWLFPNNYRTKMMLIYFKSYRPNYIRLTFFLRTSFPHICLIGNLCFRKFNILLHYHHTSTDFWSNSGFLFNPHFVSLILFYLFFVLFRTSFFLCIYSLIPNLISMHFHPGFPTFVELIFTLSFLLMLFNLSNIC